MNRPSPNSAAPMSPLERRGAAVVVVVLMALLAAAALLEPSTTGIGTHTQLGLGECFVLSQWGVRCPSCGMTTAWARLLDGRITGAVAANAGGTLLCMLALLSVPWLLASVVNGRWWYLRPTAGLLFPACAVVALVVMVDWMHHTGLALLMERIP